MVECSICISNRAEIKNSMINQLSVWGDLPPSSKKPSIFFFYDGGFDKTKLIIADCVAKFVISYQIWSGLSSTSLKFLTEYFKWGWEGAQWCTGHTTMTGNFELHCTNRQIVIWVVCWCENVTCWDISLEVEFENYWYLWIPNFITKEKR